MKLKWKIYSLCLLIYVMSIVLTALTVTTASYNSLLEKEKQRSLDEQKSIKNSASLYLLVNMKDSESEVRLEDYSERLVDMFTSKSIYLQVFSKEGRLLSDGFHISYEKDASEISNSTEGNYILRNIENKRYLFINERLDLGGDYITLTVIKDVSHVDDQKSDMYSSFFKASLIGLVVMSFLVIIMGRFITDPIEYLISASKKISQGNYNDRVTVSSQDEIGMLSQQFNTMAQEIENKIEELQRESKNKQDFIDNLTHELRTPLTSIIGYSELLMGVKYNEATFNKGLSFIYSEGKRILSMVNTLMDLILTRVYSPNTIESNVQELLESACKSISLKAEGKAVNIALLGENFKLVVDETLFKMVIINLLDNAIKASPEGGNIELYYSASDLLGEIKITDYGRGISEEHIKRLTEPFYRADKSRSRQEGGLGLGLALVQTIIAAHKGRLAITSKVGEGTSVTISIPLKEVN